MSKEGLTIKQSYVDKVIELGILGVYIEGDTSGEIHYINLKENFRNNNLTIVETIDM